MDWFGFCLLWGVAALFGTLFASLEYIMEGLDSKRWRGEATKEDRQKIRKGCLIILACWLAPLTAIPVMFWLGVKAYVKVKEILVLGFGRETVNDD